MAKLEDPETDVLDYVGLSALLSRRARSVHAYYSAMRNAILRGHGGGLSDRDRSLISNMIHVLVVDIGAALNAARTASGEEAPGALTSSLSNGWASSVYERLAKAGFLGDLDLIRALAHRTAEHLLVMRTRRPAPAALGAESQGNDEEGPFGDPTIGADRVVAQAMSDYLVERSRRFDGYGNPRMVLHEMTPGLRRRLMWACAAAWREEVAKSNSVDGTELDESVERIALLALDALDAEAAQLARAEELAAALDASGRISAVVLRALLKHGHVMVFEAVLARLLDLPFPSVREMTFEPGGARLAVALCAADVARRDIAAVFDRIAATQDGPANDFPRAIDVFDACVPEDARRMVRNWRRQPEYVEALRRMRGLPADDGGV